MWLVLHKWRSRSHFTCCAMEWLLRRYRYRYYYIAHAPAICVLAPNTVEYDHAVCGICVGVFFFARATVSSAILLCSLGQHISIELLQCFAFEWTLTNTNTVIKKKKKGQTHRLPWNIDQETIVTLVSWFVRGKQVTLHVLLTVTPCQSFGAFLYASCIPPASRR